VVAALPGRPSPHFHDGAGIDEVVDLLRRHRITAIWGVPSYIRLVLRRAAERGLTLPDVRILLLSGEELSSAMRGNIQACAQAVGADPSILASYGATELQAGYVECAPGMGFHNPAPEEFWLEILDPVTLEPQADGQEGLVVFTHLNRRGTVLLRYAIGDLAARSRDPCPHCGATVDRIVRGPRRADALIKIKGMLVDPGVLAVALDGAADIEAFQFRIRKSDPSDPFSMDDLVLLASPATQADPALTDRLKVLVKAAVGVTPSVELVPSQHLVDPGARWKAKRVIDERTAPDR
jgi:phenylacetate-coenzyme A ligase PaaK-like adenylate-forming protein